MGILSHNLINFTHAGKVIAFYLNLILRHTSAFSTLRFFVFPVVIPCFSKSSNCFFHGRYVIILYWKFNTQGLMKRVLCYLWKFGMVFWYQPLLPKSIWIDFLQNRDPFWYLIMWKWIFAWSQKYHNYKMVTQFIPWI